MPNELEKVIAALLKPKISGVGGEIPERIEITADSLALAESATASSAAPERRVDYARVGYTEAAKPDIIESFEEANLSAWTKTGGVWTQNTDQAYDGVKSISGRSGAYSGGGNTWDMLYRGSLGRPSSVAARFRYTNNTVSVNYGVVLLAGPGGAYMARYDASGYFDLGKWAAGSETILASVSGKAVNLNAWFKINLAVDQAGNLTATLYQTDGTVLATLTATDTSITSGGYGIVVAQGTADEPNARVDYLEVDTNP